MRWKQAPAMFGGYSTLKGVRPDERYRGNLLLWRLLLDLLKGDTSHNLRRGTADPDGGCHRGFSRGSRYVGLRRDAGYFQEKVGDTHLRPEDSGARDPSSICTGKKVADLRTRRFTEIMLI